MLIFALAQLESLDEIVKAEPDGIIVGLTGFSNRIQAILDPEDLSDFVKEMNDKEIDVYINGLKMFFEPEMEYASKMLDLCLKAGVKGVYAADEGLIELALEKNMEQLIIYQPETLITNGLDGRIYMNFGLQSVSLANELNLDEAIKTAAVLPEAEILVQGHYAWMDSRRPLISNYLDHIHSDIKSESSSPFLIQEMQRDYAIKAVQDENGTHLYSPVPKKSIAQISELKKAGFNRFRIDGIFQDGKTGAAWIKAYQKALNHEPVEAIEGTDETWQMNLLIKKEATNVKS